MRKLGIALLALALATPAALAVSRDEAAEIARSAANGAEVVRTERDDGVYEVELRGADADYAVELLESSGAILEIETTYPGAGGARRFELSEEQAREAAAKVAPEAARGVLSRERDELGCVYELFYAEDGKLGEVSINAESGAVVRTIRYPEAEARGILDVEQLTERLARRYPGAQLRELELEWDDGRYLYEGKLESNNQLHSFKAGRQCRLTHAAAHERRTSGAID